MFYFSLLDFDALYKGDPGSFLFSELVFSQLRQKKKKVVCLRSLYSIEPTVMSAAFLYPFSFFLRAYVVYP